MWASAGGRALFTTSLCLHCLFPSGAAAEAADSSAQKAKRNVKTPLQKEVLEASFQSETGWCSRSPAARTERSPRAQLTCVLGAAAVDANPTQQHRKALADKLELSEEQVQVGGQLGGVHWQLCGSAWRSPACVRCDQTHLSHRMHATLCTQAWFVARRRRDKKKQDSEAGTEGAGAASDAGGEDSSAPGVSGPAADALQAELLELAKTSLPVPFREDGPALVRWQRQCTQPPAAAVVAFCVLSHARIMCAHCSNAAAALQAGVRLAQAAPARVASQLTTQHQCGCFVRVSTSWPVVCSSHPSSRPPWVLRRRLCLIRCQAPPPRRACRQQC